MKAKMSTSQRVDIDELSQNRAQQARNRVVQSLNRRINDLLQTAGFNQSEIAEMDIECDFDGQNIVLKRNRNTPGCSETDESIDETMYDTHTEQESTPCNSENEEADLTPVEDENDEISAENSNIFATNSQPMEVEEQQTAPEQPTITRTQQAANRNSPPSSSQNWE